MARLNISLTNEMAKRIQESADQDGKTISSIVTESVDLYLRLKEMDLSRQQLMKMLKFQELLKSINAVPIPSLLLDPTLNIALEGSEEKVTEMWCESGRVTGEIIKSLEPDIRKLPAQFKDYSDFMPLSKMELKNEGTSIEFILMGTGYSLGSSKLTAAAMKCFLEVYGVKEMKETISEGFVKINGKID